MNELADPFYRLVFMLCLTSGVSGLIKVKIFCSALLAELCFLPADVFWLQHNSLNHSHIVFSVTVETITAGVV